MKVLRILWLLALCGCALPPADQPAHPSRMGRFIGLVANCGCSDLAADKVLAEYRKVVAGGKYTEAEIASMRGYVDIGANEKWQNMIKICAEVCSQRCMVQSVAGPLGGRGTGEAACFVSERDLHLTDGGLVDNQGGGRE